MCDHLLRQKVMMIDHCRLLSAVLIRPLQPVHHFIWIALIVIHYLRDRIRLIPVIAVDDADQLSLRDTDALVHRIVDPAVLF